MPLISKNRDVPVNVRNIITRETRILTRISFPVKVIFWIAVTLQVQSRLLPSRAMCEWNVIVGDIIEEMDFVLLQQKTGGD